MELVHSPYAIITSSYDGTLSTVLLLLLLCLRKTIHKRAIDRNQFHLWRRSLKFSCQPRRIQQNQQTRSSSSGSTTRSIPCTSFLANHYYHHSIDKRRKNSKASERREKMKSLKAVKPHPENKLHQSRKTTQSSK